EFPGLADPAKVSMSVNGEDHAKAFGKAATFIAREDGKDQSALILREVSLTQPGDYKVRVTDGVVSREITWNVYATGQRKAKNVIEDATPAAMLAHVRRRSEYDRIVEQYFAGKPDVPPIPARASCSGYLRSATWTACSIASFSRAERYGSFPSSRT